MNTPLLNVPGCPFCRENQLLQGPILHENGGGYLIAARTSAGNYLVVPDLHTESPAGLPETWWADLNRLVAQVPGLAGDYNISINIGPQAGQTVKHLHFWIIPRRAGQRSSAKGLARLIEEIDRTT